MKTNLLALTATVALVAACATDAASPAAGSQTVSFSNDLMSLSVTRSPDGRVSGQWTDQIVAGSRITVSASCLVSSGGQAVVGGVIAEADMPSLQGLDAIVRLDGTGATSYTVLGTSRCAGAPALPLLTARRGHVSIR